MRPFFILTVGLLPLWLVIAFIAYAFATMAPDSAGMSLWALLFVLPGCAVTLGLTGVTLAVHSATGGTSQRKRKVSIAFFLAAVIALAIAAQVYWLKQKDEDRKREHESLQAAAFIEAHASIVAVVGQPVRASVNSYNIRPSSPMPSAYGVYVTGSTESLQALVIPNRQAVPTTFTLVCTASTRVNLDLHNGSCDSR